MDALARLPVFLALDGKRAVLAGGSPAAAWKAELLSAAGARVDVYADRAIAKSWCRSPAIRRAAQIVLTRRAWTPGDLPGAAVAIGAFDDDDSAAAFAAAARAAGVPVNVIDKPAFCDFSFGAIVNRSPLVIGISTDGAAPVFAQAIRAKLEALAAERLCRLGRRRRALAPGAESLRPVVFRAAQVLAIVHRARGGQSRQRTDAKRLRALHRRGEGPWRRASRTARSPWSAPAPAIRNC